MKLLVFSLINIFFFTSCSTHYSSYATQKNNENLDFRAPASLSAKKRKKLKTRRKYKSPKRTKKSNKTNRIADVKSYSSSNPVTSKKYWKVTFFDDFKGKPTNSSEDNYCYDELPAQCSEWNSSSYNCQRDMQDINTHQYAAYPAIDNFTAAIKSLNPNFDFSNSDTQDILDEYNRLVGQNLRHLNKCAWSVYEKTNWMATDYNGKYSAKFDATQVKVIPQGKGYLELSARYSPARSNCAWGGELVAGNKCLVKSFRESTIQPGVNYWVDSDPKWPGVYYRKVNGSCPYGGNGPENCNIFMFGEYEIEQEINYFVDITPQEGVYYLNDDDGKHRCKFAHYWNSQGEHVPTKKVTCNILNGSIISYPNKQLDNLPGQRGTSQKEGRFEVKLKIPKGKGAFPAAWLMPVEGGGWPYRGGEIDIIEARDDADWTSATYHHGKCINKNTNEEIIWDIDDPSQYINSSTCKKYESEFTKSIHMHKGVRTSEDGKDHFQKRDHVYSVEWDGKDMQWFLNNKPTNHIFIGAEAELHDPAQPDADLGELPIEHIDFKEHNFPQKAFYYILNHSTYVSKEYLASNNWPTQKVLIDYVKTYARCKTHQDFCPTGGTFEEGKGCKVKGPVNKRRYPAMAKSSVKHSTIQQIEHYYIPSACQSVDNLCPNGGKRVGDKCVVYTPTQTSYPSLNYWVDADPRWPGIYYKKINNSCPYGGGGSVNCQLTLIPSHILEQNINYTFTGVDKVVSYVPSFDQADSTVPNEDDNKCPGLRKKIGSIGDKPICKALPHFVISQDKCNEDDNSWWNNYCLWDKGSWFRARRFKGTSNTEVECPGSRQKVGEFQDDPVCKAKPHFTIKTVNCDHDDKVIWNGWCLWPKDGWWRAREIKDDVNNPSCPWPRQKIGMYGNEPVCKAYPHFKIRESKCDGTKWSGYCIWDKDTWWRARQLK